MVEETLAAQVAHLQEKVSSLDALGGVRIDLERVSTTVGLLKEQIGRMDVKQEAHWLEEKKTVSKIFGAVVIGMISVLLNSFAVWLK